jgi:uncharacterized membrane protein YdjX (TVP38/TMEM64 family)
MPEPEVHGAAVPASPPVTNEAAPRRSTLWWKVPLAALSLVAVLLALRQLGGPVGRFVQWVDGLGPWAGVVFVLGYALAAVALLPGSILTLAAGAIFGLLRGTLYVFLGATLGACLAFLVGRYLVRAAVERRLQANPRFAAIDRAVGREGGKIVFLLRLSPVFPYNLLNYALGLTGVRFRDYALASVGMLPGTLLYVYYGKVIGDVAALAAGAEVEKGAAGWATLGLGLVATVAVTAYVTRIARRALASQVAAEEVEDGRS